MNTSPADAPDTPLTILADLTPNVAARFVQLYGAGTTPAAVAQVLNPATKKIPATMRAVGIANAEAYRRYYDAMNGCPSAALFWGPTVEDLYT